MEKDNWISVEDKLPQPEQKVFVTFISYEKPKTGIAFYTPKHYTEYDGDHEDFGEYVEEKNTVFCPEGWYEWTWTHDEHYELSNVTHWQPLLSPHKPPTNGNS